MGEYKLEGGGQEQFMLTTSVACDANPLFFIRNWSGTLVASGAASNSGDGYYYKYETLPTSEGMYTWNWYYPINAHTFIEAGRFEVVRTLVEETAGLYCQANEVLNLYDKLKEAKIRNSEIEEFISDVMVEINQSLAPRYNVDSLSGNPGINVMAKNLALVRILERKGSPPEWVTKRGEKFEGMLEAMACGSLYLVNSAGSVMAPQISADLAQVDHSMENYVPSFNMLDPEYQRIDPDRQDDESDEL